MGNKHQWELAYIAKQYTRAELAHYFQVAPRRVATAEARKGPVYYKDGKIVQKTKKKGPLM